MKQTGGRLGLTIVVCMVLIAGATVLAVSPWPKKHGVYTAKSSDLIPAFPRRLRQYRASGNNKDFWGHTFAASGSIRIFEGSGWTTVDDFPSTMNNCSSGVFMIRWRSAGPRVASTLGASDSTVVSSPKEGAFGYMFGTNCDQPMFKFPSNNGPGNLTDIYYELKFWQAAP